MNSATLAHSIRLHGPWYWRWSDLQQEREQRGGELPALDGALGGAFDSPPPLEISPDFFAQADRVKLPGSLDFAKMERNETQPSPLLVLGRSWNRPSGLQENQRLKVSLQASLRPSWVRVNHFQLEESRQPSVAPCRVYDLPAAAVMNFNRLFFCWPTAEWSELRVDQVVLQIFDVGIEQ